jgi:Putative addiction module component
MRPDYGRLRALLIAGSRMSLPLDAVEAGVLNLPGIERPHLLDRLVASLEADPEVQKAWALEAERRDAKIEKGKVKLVSGEEILARLLASLDDRPL